MAISAVVGLAVAGVAGSAMQANASENAAQTQAQSAANATQLQAQEFQVQQNNQAPFLAAGYQALNTLQQGTQPGGQFNKPFTMADFQNSAGYNFQEQQGAAGIQAAAAAGGTAGTPQAAQALASYNQGLASTSYQQQFNDYMTQQNMALNEQQSLAGMGQTAVAGVNAASQNYANQASSNMIGAGNAIAAGQVGAANAYSSGISNAGNSALNAYYMQNLASTNQMNTAMSAANPYTTQAADVSSLNGGGTIVGL